MKKLGMLSLSFLFIAVTTFAQQKKASKTSVKPLTPTEVSLRLSPEIKMLAFGPISKFDDAFIASARKADKARPLPKLKNADSVEVMDLSIPGLDKNDPLVPVRIYRPKFSAGNIPLLVWFHGGGFVAGNLTSDHQACATMAIRSKVVVISVDYRLAPENIFPAGVNDGYATLLWGINQAGKYGIDTTKVGVGGGSAGAAIAGSIVLKARAEKGPKIKAQLLVFPPSDLDTTHVSVIEYRNIPALKGADLTKYLKLYLGEKQYKNVPDYALPGLAKDLKNIPPTYILTCGVDPLRDGGLLYAKRLIEAGIYTEVHNYAGYPHGFVPERANTELYYMANKLLNQ
ncbi:alpha/beta hydrolase fold domain-containing protein [Pedobacter rhodius]|uniref:Alpha/beta hydrolase fold domain-containing protein n=1 Tax=Pedobacter rhodius TaxID=3004098 RepID=A0ABT4KYE8_9SPHI|nr:alpha/beta hydrolase fold domain-containing protein [Pedobacter sp. SJ11]MCZ4223958.1 alpha/beta hydrolase fold domain-containing protein [Pedobacter sp. SJ11]